jgi:hypothetical protein
MEVVMKNQFVQTTLIFIALVLIYAVLIVVGRGIQDAFAQHILTGTGSAILAAGLTFFLLRMVQLRDK